MSQFFRLPDDTLVNLDIVCGVRLKLKAKDRTHATVDIITTVGYHDLHFKSNKKARAFISRFERVLENRITKSGV